MTATRQQSLEAMLGYRGYRTCWGKGMILGDLLAEEWEPPFMELFGHARIASPCPDANVPAGCKTCKNGRFGHFWWQLSPWNIKKIRIFHFCHFTLGHFGPRASQCFADGSFSKMPRPSEMAKSFGKTDGWAGEFAWGRHGFCRDCATIAASINGLVFCDTSASLHMNAHFCRSKQREPSSIHFHALWGSAARPSACFYWADLDFAEMDLIFCYYWL